MNIDTEANRNDLVDYYGTAMFVASPMAMMDVSKAEKAIEQESVRMAKAARLNSSRYQR